MPRIAISFMAAIYAVYCLAGSAITRIPKDRFAKEEEIRILIDFERNVTAYSKSSRFRYDSVFVGPSYAAMLGRQKGAYNLGITSGFKEETEFVIKNICRDEDRLLYVLNLWETGAGELRGLVAIGDRKNIRPEIRSRMFRRRTLVKWLIQDYVGKLSGSSQLSEDHRQMRSKSERKTRIPLEDLAYVLDNGEDDEYWLNRNAITLKILSKKKDSLSEAAKYYKKLQTDRSGLLYIYLPCLPMKKHPSNQRLNTLIEIVRKREVDFLNELDKENIKYVNLQKALGPRDYIDIIHLRDGGSRKTGNFLYELGQI